MTVCRARQISRSLKPQGLWFDGEKLSMDSDPGKRSDYYDFL